MTLVHWNDAESPAGAWDFVWLGGMLLAGIAKVSVKLSSDLDVKKPQGGTGATIADKGDPPAEIVIELNLANQNELNQLETMRSKLRPKSKSGARDPLEIVHPNPNFWGITAVTVKDIDSPSPDAVGGWNITITCVEWFPAPKKTPKPSKKPKDESSAWAPYADDGVAGSGYIPPPSKDGSAVNNLGLPHRRAA